MSKIPRRTSPIGLAALCTALLALMGCGGGRSPGHDHDRDHDHDEEHVGHVIPAHKPKTFPDGVRRLRELNDRFAASLAAGPDPKDVAVAIDIANWLPEIAADCDMPEAPWNVVNDRSAVLAADYQALLPDSRLDAAEALREAGGAIRTLEKLLAEADPRWFGGDGKGGTHP